MYIPKLSILYSWIYEYGSWIIDDTWLVQLMSTNCLNQSMDGDMC